LRPTTESRRPRVRSAAISAAAVILIAQAHATAQDNRALVDRVRDYVARFELEVTALVAEEHYAQYLSRRGANAENNWTRELRSDYVLLKPADTLPWLGYRDVFEVDGKPVRERDARIVEILGTTRPDSLERAAAFALEGARFNLGPERTINTPTLPLQFLSRHHAGRIVARAGRVDRRNDRGTITFVEPNAPTIVRTPDGQDVWSRGEVTVRLSDAAIVRAIVRFRFPRALARDESMIEVEYADVDGIPVPVPVRMIERLAVPAGTRASGEATYSNYRRFQTSARIR
jgi:hypothetical protein